MKRLTLVALVCAVLLATASPAFASARSAKAWKLRSQVTKAQNSSLKHLHTTWFESMGYRYGRASLASITVGGGPADTTGTIEVLDPVFGYSVRSSLRAGSAQRMVALESSVTTGVPDEGTTRAQASAMYATALALSNGTYSASRVGVSRAAALRRTVAWTNGLAIAHGRGEWGRSWQSALWAYYLGAGSKRIWGSLSPLTRELVAESVAEEADRLLATPPPYYRDASGTVVYPGDSKAEENSWNATLLFLAARMFSAGDPVKAAQWEARGRWYALTAFATPDQVGTDPRIEGSNANPDGTVTNHGIVHPDYMASAGAMRAKSLMIASWARSKEATECANRQTLVYDGLTKLKFRAGPLFRKPGGTIYRKNSHGAFTASVYYPQGTDWSRVRVHNLALMDVSTFAGGRDIGYSLAKVHIAQLLHQQARHKDGHVFSRGETTYPLDEQFAAVCAAEMVETLRTVH